MSLIIITKQNAAATLSFDINRTTYMPPITIVSNGLVGVETVSINISDDNGMTFSQLFDYQTGLPVILNSTHNSVSIYAPGRYKVIKSITAAAVGVSLSSMALA